MGKMIRLGYHRVSDDSVTSAWLTINEANERIKELMFADVPDVDHVWYRNENDEVVWEWKGESS